MGFVVKFPLLVLIAAFLLQCAAAYAGDALGSSVTKAHGMERKDFVTILGSALTLLALLIGFSLTMAVNRYDERKTLEEAEANAIGTEYLRASLVTDAAPVRVLLARYADARIAFYVTRDDDALRKIDATTVAIQDELWTRAEASSPNSTPTVALALSGMNDVINSAGYTGAAWLNRIPDGVWLLMAAVSIACNFLLGYAEEHRSRGVLLVLPAIVAISLFLIADVDSPRHGVIRVQPDNLIATAATLGPRS